MNARTITLGAWSEPQEESVWLRFCRPELPAWGAPVNPKQFCCGLWYKVRRRTDVSAVSPYAVSPLDRGMQAPVVVLERSIRRLV